MPDKTLFMYWLMMYQNEMWNSNTSSHIHIKRDTGKNVVLISVIESKLDIYILSSI